MARMANIPEDTGSRNTMTKWWRHPIQTIRNGQRVLELVAEVNELRDRLQSEYGRRYDLETQLRHAQSRLTCDPLTGALNREGLNQLVSELQNETQQKSLSGRGAIIAIDLDRFKEVNDTHGHKAGDMVLQLVVEKFNEIKLDGIQVEVVRPGGDEFIIAVLDRRTYDRGEALHGEYEKYIKGVFRDAFLDVEKELHLVVNNEGDEVGVRIGISDGYSFFSEVSEDAIFTALSDADYQSFMRKSGLEELMQCVENKPHVAQFLTDVMGFQTDPTARGGYSIDRSMGMSSVVQHEGFARISADITPRALRWIFPELKPQRSQIDLGPGR